MKMKCHVKIDFANANFKIKHIVNKHKLKKNAKLEFCIPMITFTATAFTKNSAYGIYIATEDSEFFEKLKKFNKQEIDINEIIKEIVPAKCHFIAYRATDEYVQYYKDIHIDINETGHIECCSIAEQMTEDFNKNL